MTIPLYNLRDYRHKPLPPGVKRIDRRTPFGNPFRMGRSEDREIVIEEYRDLLRRDYRLRERIKRELGLATGLACWCWPKPCHGEPIIEVLEDRLTGIVK